MPFLKRLIIFLLTIITGCLYAQNIGVKTISPQAVLDVNGSVAIREGGPLSIANGTNNNVAIDSMSFYRITAPTAAFSITGFLNGTDGRLLTIFNATTFTMILKHLSSLSTATNRINTGGSDMAVPPNGTASLSYNATLGNWIVTGSQGVTPTFPSIATGALTDSIVTVNSGVLGKSAPQPYISSYAWSLLGNSGTAVGTNFIGTTDAQGLAFRSNNTEWMRMSTTGSIGLGLTSPSVKLHQDAGTAIATYHKFTANATTGQTATDGFDVGIDAAGNAVLKQNEALPMIFSTNATERMRILSGGNIGINMTNPLYKLDIDANTGSTGNPLRLQGLQAGATSDSIISSNSGILRRLSIAQVLGNAWNITGNAGTTAGTNFIGTTDAQDLVFKTAGTEVLRATTANYVGIGITTPLSRLHLGGENSPTLTIRGTGVTNTDAYSQGGISMYESGSTVWGFTMDLLSAAPASTVYSGNVLRFRSIDAGTNTDRMVIQNTGNVGIGMSLPNYKLDIDAITGSNGNPLRLQGLQAGSLSDSIISSNNGVLRRLSISQVNGNPWNITGNSGTTAGTNFIGTTDAQDLVFKTAGTEAARITTANYVGLGISTPISRLHLGGENTPTLTLRGTGTANTDAYSQGGINMYESGSTVWGFSMDFMSPAVASTTYSGNTLRFRALQGGTYTDRMVLHENGNLGLGLTSPSVKLHIDGGTATASYQKFTANTTTGQTTNDGFDIGIDAAGNAVLDQNEALAMIFNTSALERMRILSSGNIGINTNAPSYKLDINANTGSTGNPLRLQGLQAGTTADSIVSSSSGILRRLSIAQVIGSGAWATTGNSGTTAGTNFVGTTDAQDLVFKTNGTEAARMTTGNNIGLGLTAPSVKLHQDNGTATASYHKFTANTTTGQLATDGFDVGIDAAGNAVLKQNEALPMIFSTSATERMRILSSGNIGINTTTPTYKLDIDANTGSAGNPLRLQGLQAGTTADSIVTSSSGLLRRMSMNNLAWSLLGNSGTTAGTNFIGTTDAQDLVFKTNGTEAVRVTTGNNVGIGITTPSTVLDVNGSVAMREGTPLTVANGTNNNVALSAMSFYRITAPTANYTITGFTGGSDGRLLTVMNATSYTLTLKHQVTSTAANQLNTGGSDMVLTSNGVATFAYNATLTKWVLTGGQGFTTAVFSGWSTTGNSGTTAGTNFLGTTDSKDVVIKTNNTEVLRMTTGNFVGINVSSPEFRLHIEDPAGIDADVLMRNYKNGIASAPGLVLQSAAGTKASPIRVTTNEALGIIRFGGYDGSAFNSGSAAEIISSATQSWTTSAHGSKIEFKTIPNSTTTNYIRMVLDESGNVGIGNSFTTAPQYNLDVDGKTGGTGDPIRLQGLNAGSLSDSIVSSNNGVLRRLSIAQIAGSSSSWGLTGNSGTTAGTNFIGTTDNQDLVFKTNSAEEMRITSGGNVGINTTSPNAYLDVNGSVAQAITTTSSNLTLNNTHYTVILTGGSPTITLPAASTCARRIYVIVNNSGGSRTVRVSGSTGWVAFGASSDNTTSLANSSAVTIQSNGTYWYRIQ